MKGVRRKMKNDHLSSYPDQQPSLLSAYRWYLETIEKKLRIETDPKRRERLERDRAYCLKIIHHLKEENHE